MNLEALPWAARVPAACLTAGGGKLYVAARANESTTDCSRLYFNALKRLYGRDVERERPALMLYAVEEPWSPVEGLVRLGFAETVTTPRAGCWHAVQGNRALTPSGYLDLRERPNGHTFFYYEPPSPLASWEGVVCEANRGPFCYSAVWTDRIAPYKAGVRIAVLKEPTR